MSFPRSLSEFRSRTLAAVNVVADHFGGDDLVKRNIHDMIKYQRRDDLDEDLILAMRKSDVAATCNLLNQGANPDSHGPDSYQGEFNLCALELACSRGREDIVSALLNWDVTLTSDCLPAAIYSQLSTSVLQSLIEHGAEVNPDCLEAAICAKSVAMARFVLEKGDLRDFVKREGANIIHRTIDSSDFDVNITSLLFDFGAGFSMEYPDEDIGVTTDYLLNAASIRPNCECIQLLLSRGAQLNSLGTSGVTPLMQLSMSPIMYSRGAPESLCYSNPASKRAVAARLLLESGASVDFRDNNENTALMLTAQSRNVSVAQVLLAFKTDVNLKNNEGNSALHFAVFEGNLSMVQLLLERGAPSEDNLDRALSTAQERGHSDVCRLLKGEDCSEELARTRTFSFALREAAVIGDGQKFDSLLLDRADPETTDEEGYNAFMLAAKSGFLSKCFRAGGLHISFRRCVNEKNQSGESILHIAAESQVTRLRKRLLRFVVECEANLNLQTSLGRTALMSAARHRHYDTAHVLLSHKADVNLRDNEGNSALSLAVLSGDLKMTRILVEKGGPADSVLADALATAQGEGQTDVTRYLEGIISLEHESSSVDSDSCNEEFAWPGLDWE